MENRENPWIVRCRRTCISSSFGSHVALWLAAFAVNPWDHHLSIAPSFHIGVWGGTDGPIFGRLVFFNDDEYGPYRGSIVALSDGQGKVPPEFQPRVSEWGDSYGVYYRHFYFPKSDKTLWTLMISLLYPFALSAVLPLHGAGVGGERRCR